jgi:cell division protein FtsL
MSAIFAKPLPGGSLLMLVLFLGVLVSAVAVSCLLVEWRRHL